ncbi:MAG: aminoacyl-tRNA hydrolase [Psychroflexus sp.]|uniref:Aminoacyl-tRNA hydrolase n=2 Tax=Mesohalobacter halotolerans TaxID=1883405 RepID=A0A4U5TTH8_9FLAO|nr:aminoacyl-tRNA hydrolase [Psychroflexus sp.]TKS57680.1 aminoacyl-tRNA hydrolase [Mesohalobacter halotolerans]
MMDFEQILNEVEFSTALSSGAGGQHVNKTETKVNLSWSVDESDGLLKEEKYRILRRLKHKINKKGYLQLSCSDTRSQHQNKKILINRFKEILNTAIQKPKKRKATKPTKSSIHRRLKNKSHQAQKKSLRQKPDY